MIDPRLEEALDACLEEVRAGASVEEALARRGAVRAELEPLVLTALALRESGHVELPENRRMAIRQRVMQRVAARDAAPSFRWSLGWWLTRVTAVAGGLALAVGSLGLASANALPDSPLYPVKLAREQVQVALTFDPAARAELLLNMSNQRLEEANQMLSKNEPRNAAAAIQRYQKTIDRGTAVAMQAAATDPKATTIVARAAQQTSQHEEKEKAALAAAPDPKAKAVLEQAVKAASEAQARLAAAAGSPAALSSATATSAVATATPSPTPSPTAAASPTSAPSATPAAPAAVAATATVVPREAEKGKSRAKDKEKDLPDSGRGQSASPADPMGTNGLATSAPTASPSPTPSATPTPTASPTPAAASTGAPPAPGGPAAGATVIPDTQPPVAPGKVPPRRKPGDRGDREPRGRGDDDRSSAPAGPSGDGLAMAPSVSATPTASATPVVFASLDLNAAQGTPQSGPGPRGKSSGPEGR